MSTCFVVVISRQRSPGGCVILWFQHNQNEEKQQHMGRDYHQGTRKKCGNFPVKQKTFVICSLQTCFMVSAFQESHFQALALPPGETQADMLGYLFDERKLCWTGT